jgi:hypothetical protein
LELLPLLPPEQPWFWGCAVAPQSRALEAVLLLLLAELSEIAGAWQACNLLHLQQMAPRLLLVSQLWRSRHWPVSWTSSSLPAICLHARDKHVHVLESVPGMHAPMMSTASCHVLDSVAQPSAPAAASS